MLKKAVTFLHIPVITTALFTCIRLSGLPGAIHITPARISFLFLTLTGCLLWFWISRSTKKNFSKQGVSTFVFQSCLLIIFLSFVLIYSAPFLLQRNGLLYSAGAVIREVKPFLIFLIVLSACFALLVISSLRQNGQLSWKTLIFANTIIIESVIIFAACLLVFGAFIPLRDNYYPSHDSAIFSYIGQQILRGKIPYTELWDHKPPLIFYFDALGLKLAGGSPFGIWLMEFVLFFTGALILLTVLKKYFPKWISLTVLFFGILHYVHILDFGNYTEELSLFFVICASGLFFTASDTNPTFLYGLLNGILCGFAFTSKQNTIGCWIALFLLSLFDISLNNDEKTRGKEILNYWLSSAIGFLIVNTGWIIYFASKNALSAYWDVAFRFNFIYSDRSSENRLACAWTTLTFLPSESPYLLLAFISWIPAFTALIRNMRKFIRVNRLTAWAVFSLPIELVLAGLSGMNYQHYFILCITPAMILLCYTLKLLSGKITVAPLLKRIFIPLLLCASSLPLMKFFSANYMPRTPSSYTKARDYMLNETVPDQSVLVWGSRTAIYVMSNRYAPTAYFNERPLYLFPDEIQEKQWEELYADLQRDPPQVIIYTHDTALPFVTENEGKCILPDSTANYSEKVYRYFCENYRYETTINPEFYDAWDIYRRN